MTGADFGDYYVTAIPESCEPGGEIILTFNELGGGNVFKFRGYAADLRKVIAKMREVVG